MPYKVLYKRSIAIWTLFAFLASFWSIPQVSAQELYLPNPGQMVPLSAALNPVVLKGIKLEANDPFKFHFFVDSGDSKLGQEELKAESSKLIKYFLASLTTPEKDLWVNLSPYEKDRIVPKEFGQTEMGRDLLAQDYLLKQITASLIYPEDELGKTFWQKVYAQAQAKFGTTNIPVNTFNKVWILPEKAVIYEHEGTAFVLENHLKVMLEQDYLALQKNEVSKSPQELSKTSALGSQIVREIVIPALTKEVNEGKNFAQLRQVFYSLILATWYKKKIKESILNKIYANQNKTAGIDIYSSINKTKQNKTNPSLSLSGLQDNPDSRIIDPQLIYQQYLQAFKKGVYNYIKEEQDPITKQSVPRKYFSGGIVIGEHLSEAMVSEDNAQIAENELRDKNLTEIIGKTAFLEDAAMVSDFPELNANDVVFSQHGFGDRLEKGTYVWKDFKDEVGEAKEYTKSTKTITVKGKKFVLVRKRSGRAAIVFSLDESSFKELVKLKGWKPKENIPDVDENDVPFSRPGFAGALTAGDNKWYVFQSKVEDAKNYPEQTKTITVKGKKFVLTRKRSGSSILFTLPKERFKELAELMEWVVREELPLVDDQDVIFSFGGFSEALEAGEYRWREFRSVVGDANEEISPTKTITVKGKKFTLIRKFSRTQKVFTLTKESFKELATLQGWSLKEGLSDVGAHDVSFSETGFKERLEASKAAWDDIKSGLGEAEDYPDLTKTIVVKGQEFVLTRKRTGPHIVFSLPEEQFNKFAELSGWRLKADLPNREAQDIVFSTTGFNSVLVGGDEVWRDFQPEVGDAKSYGEPTKTVTIKDQTFVFVRKRVGSHTAFTLDKNEFSRLARIKGWESREDVNEIIEKEGIESVISSFSDDPQMLLGYLLLTTNLDPIAINKIVRSSFEGFKGFTSHQIDLTTFIKAAGSIQLTSSIPAKTSEPSIIIEGKVEGDFDRVCIVGDRNRTVDIKKDGTFRTRVILQAGEQVSLTLAPINEENETVGKALQVKVKQTGIPKNFEEIMLDLLTTKDEIAQKITKDPIRLAYLKRRLEIGLLSHFTESEEEGFAYLDRTIKGLKNSVTRNLYNDIRTKFRLIASIDTQGLENFKIEGFSPDEKMFFYQKYALYELLQGIEAYEQGKTNVVPARVLALEQGLGKTLVALAAVRNNEEGALVVSPNSVVSTWAEQEAHFFAHPRSVPLRGSSTEKTKGLEASSSDAIRIVNIEYLRSTEQKRFDALNNQPEQMVVLDESQAFSREGSLQVEGAQKIKGRYTVLISATPFANPQAARSLLKFMTNQTGMKDAKIFNQYFLNDPDSIRLLHFLIDQYVIRIKKKHVFKNYDYGVPLEEQNNRLPEKVYVEPSDIGEYTLTDEQSDSILDLFFNWDSWSQRKAELTKSHKAVATRDDQERVRGGELFFAKMHSLRQLMNDPKYAGIQQDSPKHQEMDKIIASEIEPSELNKDGGKVVIFCAYKEQVKSYVERYARYGAVSYYGDTLADQVNSDGYVLNATTKKPLLFRKVNEFEYAVDKKGQLIPDTKGVPITALDYNRYRFQNDPTVKVLVATYDVGGVGVTFTAADAVVFDDLARDYTVMYQAEDRANRLDNLRKKYQTRYYRLEARYPASFLKRLEGKYAIFSREGGSVEIVNKGDEKLKEAKEEEKTIWDLRELFSRGTYDQIQGYNVMTVQRRLFELVLDGLEDEDDLDVISRGDLKKKMPFLFERMEQRLKSPKKKGSDAAMTSETEEFEEPGIVPVTENDAVLYAEDVYRDAANKAFKYRENGVVRVVGLSSLTKNREHLIVMGTSLQAPGLMYRLGHKDLLEGTPYKRIGGDEIDYHFDWTLIDFRFANGILNHVYIFPPSVKNPRIEMTDALAVSKGINKKDLPENRSDKTSSYEVGVRDEIIVTARIIYKALSLALGDGVDRVDVMTERDYFSPMKDNKLKTLAEQKTSFDSAMTSSDQRKDMVVSRQGDAFEEFSRLGPEVNPLNLPQFNEVLSYLRECLTRYEERIKNPSNDHEKKEWPAMADLYRKSIERLARLHTANKIYVRPMVITAKNNFAAGFSSNDHIIIAKEFESLSVPLLAEYFMYLVMDFGHDQWRFNNHRELFFDETLPAKGKFSPNILRETIKAQIKARAVVHNGIDYQAQIRQSITAMPQPIDVAFTDESDSRVSSNLSYGGSDDWDREYKEIIRSDKPIALYGGWEGIGNAAETFDGLEGHDKRHKNNQIKLILDPSHGLVGVWGIPNSLNDLIKKVLVERGIKSPIAVDIANFARMVRFYQLGYEAGPEVFHGFLSRLISPIVEQSPLISNEQFSRIVEERFKRWQPVYQMDHDSRDHALEEKDRREADVITNTFALLEPNVKTEYMREYLRNSRLNIGIADRFLESILPRNIYSGGERIQMLWAIYLDSRNTDDENQYFRGLLIRGISYEHVAAIGKIERTFTEGTEEQKYKALQLFLRLQYRQEDHDSMFGLIEHAGAYQDIVAAFCLAHVRMFGIEVRTTRRGGYEPLNEIVDTFSPQVDNVYLHLLNLDGAVRQGGTANRETDNKIFIYSRFLDRNGSFPGEHGHTWFTSLREGLHRSVEKNHLYYIQAILYFWQNLDKKAFKDVQRKTLSTWGIFDSVAEDHNAPTYSQILNNLFNLLQKRGEVTLSTPEANLSALLLLDQEHVIEALHEANPNAGYAETVEYMLGLCYALHNKFNTSLPRAIEEIKSEEEMSALHHLSESTNFPKEPYQEVLKALDGNDDVEILRSIANLRVAIKRYMLKPGRGEAPNEKNFYSRNDVENTLLDLDHNLKVVGRESLNHLLNQMNNIDSVSEVERNRPVLVSALKFIYASGIGHVDIEQLIYELENGSLTTSQLHDLIRALQTETLKATQQLNQTARFVMPHILTSTSPYELDSEWQEKMRPFVVRTKTTDRGFEHEEVRFSPQATTAASNMLLDDLIRESGVDVVKGILTKMDQVLEQSSVSTESSKQEPVNLVLDNQFYRFAQGDEQNHLPPFLSLWSKKGLNLLRMSEQGVHVPPGVIVSSNLMTRGDILHSPEFKTKVANEIERLRQFSKYPDLKLLLYARSGSAFMLPGLLATIPNIGMNDHEAEELAKSTGDMWFAYDTYASLIRSFGINVFGIPEKHFQEVFNVYTKDQVNGERMKEVCELYKQVIAKHANGKTVPDSMIDQVITAMEAVYNSWSSPSARAYRERHRISDQWGTVVILQKGVFGNMTETKDHKISGSGSATLVIAPDGRPMLQGEFRYRGQGDQIMSQADQNTVSLNKEESPLKNGQTFEQLNPELYQRVLAEAVRLKKIFGYDPLIEFVFERGDLWITQSNDDFNREDFPEFSENIEAKPLVRGKGLSGGAVRGWAANSIEEAARLFEQLKVLKARNSPEVKDVDGVVLLLDRVNPEMIGDIPQGVHILAKKLSVHAMSLAQESGISVVSEVPDNQMTFDVGTKQWIIAGQHIQNGQTISLDGHRNSMMYHKSGNIYLGAISLKESASNAEPDAAMNSSEDQSKEWGTKDKPWSRKDTVEKLRKLFSEINPSEMHKEKLVGAFAFNPEGKIAWKWGAGKGAHERFARDLGFPSKLMGMGMTSVTIEYDDSGNPEGIVMVPGGIGIPYIYKGAVSFYGISEKEIPEEGKRNESQIFRMFLRKQIYLAAKLIVEAVPSLGNCLMVLEGETVNEYLNNNKDLDGAMITREGGINLNPAQMTIETKTEGQSFHFNFNGQEIDAAQVVGVKFDIQQMLPVTNLPMLLGMSKGNPSQELALNK